MLDISDEFFFSSRRRHTRWPRDWSSDVCSSDLRVGREDEDEQGGGLDAVVRHAGAEYPAGDLRHDRLVATRDDAEVVGRSEERRVGKECRWRWWRRE